LPGHLRYRRALRLIEGVVERVISERRSRPENDAGDLLSTLMAAKDDEGRPLSDRQLRDEVITLLLAGHETTALALSWTWYLLSQHPEIEANLAAEVQRVVGGRTVTVADLPNLPFADQIVTEAMRLYPPAWAIGREAVNDGEIGGYAVPAGTTVYMSQWVVQRDPRHFERPDEFRPERWSGDAVKRLPRFAYFPFGGGPRICIGNRFAQMEAVLILVTMAQRFRMRWRGERVVMPLPSITLRPAGSLWVEVQARR
jgi:cytochrome P450